MLRYYPNGFYEVEREDDAWFYVRQYVPVKVDPPADLGEVLTPLSPPQSDFFSWRPFDTGLPRSGQWRDNFAVADMNGDGFPDLVFAPARKTLSKPDIFLGDGKGNWKLWTEARYPVLPYDYGGTVVADFNGDGKGDIGLGMHLLGLAVLTGDGKGQFSEFRDGLPLRRSNEQPILSSRHVLAYDWKGDGKPALVALNERMGADPIKRLRDGAIAFVNDKGAWTPAPSEPPMQQAMLMTSDASARKLALLDPPSVEGKLRISERSAGQWQIHEVVFPSNVFLTAFAMTEMQSGGEKPASGNTATEKIVADATKSAKAAATEHALGASIYAIAYRRFAQSAWWTHVELIREREGEWQRVPLSSQRDALGITGLAFGKLRPGAFRDLVFVDEDGELGILREAADGSYTRDRTLPTPAWRGGCQGYGLQTVDLDRDGIDEVVVSFAGESSAMVQPDRQCTSGGAIEAFKISSKH
jgi:hypothetical protein